MKYYKLTRTGGGYDPIHNGSKAFELGKIYPEDCTLGNTCNVGTYAKDSSFWIEVPEIDYFVQEGKMPEYFAIKRVEGDPLWQKYIDYLNDTYNTNWGGYYFNFYGYDNSQCFGGTDGKFSLEEFKNNTVELTLKQWDKIINKTMEEEFELQKVWFIQLTEENKELVEKWHRSVDRQNGRSYDIGSFYGVYSTGVGDVWSYDYLPKHTQVITTEQFIKYVLNQEVMEENKEIIGWKLKEDCKQYEKACVSISELSIYPKERGYYCVRKNDLSICNFKQAGVLELWFNPVYKEKTLKFGSYDVTFEKVTSGVRISCNGETGTFSQIQAIYNYFKPNSINFKFGSQEVRHVIYDKKEWNIAPGDDEPTFIKIGCTTGDWSEFVAIYEKAKSML